MPRYFLYPFLFTFPTAVFFTIQQIFFKDEIPISVSFVNVYNLVMTFFSMFCTAIAIYLGYSLILKYQKSVKNTIKVKVIWLKRILQFAIFIFSIWVFTALYINFYSESEHLNQLITYTLWTAMSVLIYWMGYSGIYHLELFKKQISNGLISSLDGENVDFNQSLFNKIDSILNNEKLYLDPNMGLSLLADRVNLSEGYISQLFNKGTGKGFSENINALRVAYAQKLLKDTAYDHYTILAIAIEAGFNSKSVFYASFKKHTGITPIAYKNTEKKS